MGNFKGIVLGLFLQAIPFAAFHLDAGEDPGERKVRVGTYSSRAVALAYGRSSLFEERLKGWRLELEEARRKEEADRAAILEKKAKREQNLAHMQVFGSAPIPDILKELEGILQETARRERLDLIARREDIAYRDPSVELVDITEALMMRLKPSEETLKIAKEIDKHPPVPLEEFPIDCCGESKDAGPESLPPVEKSGRLCAEFWIKLVDDGLYAESWEKASSHFRSVVDRKKWIGEAGSLRSPLGKVISRKVRSSTHCTTLPEAPPGEYVVTIFEAAFEKRPSAIETVTCVLDSDGRWRVDGYYLR